MARRTNQTDAEYLRKRVADGDPLNRAERRAYERLQRKEANSKRRGKANG